MPRKNLWKAVQKKNMSSIIDFHSHVLPGIDDGSQSIEESLEMMRLSAAQGVDCMIATPHFYAHHDEPKAFLRRRAEAEQRLREAMADQPLPKLALGAEVYYFNGISDSDTLLELTIQQKRYILLEMPMTEWTDRMYRDLEGIWIKQGLMPIIAHIDRYISPFHSRGVMERLAKLPVLVQANASFFTSGSTRKMAMRMLKNGQIHLLGSDCHNLTDRAPNLADAVKAIEKKLGIESIYRINYYEDEVLVGE